MVFLLSPHTPYPPQEQKRNEVKEWILAVCMDKKVRVCMCVRVGVFGWGCLGVPPGPIRLVALTRCRAD